MCGISGCLTLDDRAMEAVVLALNKLQNRGYDSAGICSSIDGKFIFKKSVSNDKHNAVQEINNDPLSNVNCKYAIGHTRWATHGPKTEENAHPHFDSNNRFSIVHNGIIENYIEIKEFLMSKGINDFYGQTDTEVVAKYIGYAVEQGRIITDVAKDLKGSWAILVLDNEHSNKIWYMVNGSPLIIGWNADKTKAMFVSEFIGFDSDINEYAVLENGDYGSITLDKTVELESTKLYTLNVLHDIDANFDPAPYAHWTLKEINDQPSAITDLLLDRLVDNQLMFPEIDSLGDSIKQVEHFIFLACGTSYHAAQIGARYFRRFGLNATINVIDGADFEAIDLPSNRKSALVLLSQSGETKDLYRALEIGKEQNVLSIGLINVENSLIAREVDCCLYLKAKREHAVASTKSFTNQVLMLIMLAIYISPNIDSEIRKEYIDSIANLPNDYYNIINQSSLHVNNLVEYYNNQQSSFILGKHALEWVAKEGSLKVKEISYIHCEGFSAAALKHGPFALLSKNTPVILLIEDDEYYPKLVNAAAEVKSRHASVMCITNKPVDKSIVDYQMYFETKSKLWTLMSVVPLQFLAYYLALNRGNNPDYPRNLAKVVTVE